MQVEVGNVIEGKISGITHFGAFVVLPDNQTGMVHISEISNAYVKEISDYVSEDDAVKVKVLSIADDGKISLSMKQCEENQAQGQPQGQSQGRPAPRPPRREVRRSGPTGPPPPRTAPPRDLTFQPRGEDSGNSDFEDMMTRFKQVSNDRLGELKRANDPRRARKSGSAR